MKYAGRTLSLKAGVEIFNNPWFEGELSYLLDKRVFRGTITYLGRILWIKNPKLTVQWSKNDGFEIVHFPILDDIPGFDFLGAVAKVLYNLISGIVKWGVQLHVTTDRNPDPSKYLVKLVVKGDISVTILGFITCKLIPLPDIPLRIPKVDNFSFGRLPEYIGRCLWESAGDICKSLLRYINPFELAKQMGKRILDAVTGAIASVVNVVKKVVKKVWGWCKSWFGCSAFILDSETNTVLGYIYAGKGGRKLCHTEFVVNHFGPYLATHALGLVAGDIHRNANACVNAEKSTEEDDEVIRNKLDELKMQTTELESSLHLAADDLLTVRNIKAEIINEQLHIEWEVCNDSGETVYNGDKGDIEHHIEVTVMTVQHNHTLPEIEIETVYDDVWTAQCASQQNNENEQCKQEDSHPDEAQEKQTYEKEWSGVQTKNNDPDKDGVDAKTEEVAKSAIREQSDSELKKNGRLMEKEIVKASIEGDCSGNETGAEKDWVDVKNDEVTISTQSETRERNRRGLEATPTQVKDDFGEINEAKERIPELQDQEQMTSTVVGVEQTTLELNKGESKVGEKAVEQDSSREKHPSTMIEIDEIILKQAIKVTVSILPTVTLKVITPISNLGVVSQEKLESTDKVWMELMKEEIKKTGREKEVTLYGRKSCEEILNKHVLDSDVLISASCRYSQTGENVTIYGTMHPMPGCSSYLIQVVDNRDFTIIVKQLLIPLHGQVLGFRIKLTSEDLKNFSCGPYIVRVMALTSEYGTSQCVTIPDLEIPRHASPTDLNMSLSDPNNEDEPIKITWKFPCEHDSESDDFVPHFRIRMFVTYTKEAERVAHKDLDSTSPEFRNGQIADMTVSIPNELVSRFAENYECSFSLKELFSENGIPHQSGAFLEFEVTTYGPLKLPSKPKSVDFILVSSPKNIKAVYSEEYPGLQLSWCSTPHTVSYLVEAIDKNAAVTLSKQCDHDKCTLDVDALLDINDLRGLNSSGSYKVQVHSLGFGEDLHSSLIPTIAINKLHIMPVEIEFFHKVDTIIVRFNPNLSGLSYTVSLYKHVDGQNPYLFQSECCHSQTKLTVTQKFRGYKKWWGTALTADCSILAWVHNSMLSPVEIGISTNKLQIQAPPSEITVVQKQELDLSIRAISFSWSVVSGVYSYQYGLYNTESGKVFFHKTTTETQAAITFSSLQFGHLDYIHVECFVRSEGNATTLTSDPILVTTTYQCIVNDVPGMGKRVIVYTSIQLHQVWSRYIAVLNCNDCLLTPRNKYFLFPHVTRFPNISVCSRIWEKFWNPESPSNEG